MKLIFDIESNNYLEHMDRIHCIVAQDYDTGRVYQFRPNEMKEALEFLASAKMIIGHNIISFDIPAIKKIYPDWEYHGKVFDTLIAARFAYPDIKEQDFAKYRSIMNVPNGMRTDLQKLKMKTIGQHSLEAYGIRMGEHKGTFGKEVGFEEYSEDMMKYCVQDVNVNTKLYDKLIHKGLDLDVLDIEFEAHTICDAQKTFGFKFDREGALELHKTLEKRYEELQDDVKSKLGGIFIIPLEVKVPKRNVSYKEVLRGSYKAGCQYTKILIKEFNPTSRHDVTTRLMERFNWVPTAYGSDKKPTLDESVLKKMDLPIAKTLSEMLMIQKRLGQLATGQQAWLKMYNEETGAIHGSINTLGTGTHRCTHSRPNLGQIPSVRAPYGKECRELFVVEKGWKLFGTDAAGLELRMLAHYMHRWDNGAYADVILNGDIHTTNQEAAGLSSRPNAKTFIYAKIYGSGINNLATVCGYTVKEMKVIVKSFDNNLPALKSLTDAVKEIAEQRGWVKGLDGRRIPVRSAHSALNFLLQSAGAIVCKYWMVELHRLLKSHGYVHGVHFKQSAFVHDELQISFDPKVLNGEYLGDISKRAIKIVGDRLNINIPLDSDWDVGDSYADTH